MKILADENFPKSAVDALRANGHDVVWITTDSPGLSDVEVLNKAIIEERLLLTFDKDFGEIAFRDRRSSPTGIILFRVFPGSPEQTARLAVDIIGSRNDWSQHFSVIEEDRIRMIPIISEDIL